MRREIVAGMSEKSRDNISFIIDSSFEMCHYGSE